MQMVLPWLAHGLLQPHQQQMQSLLEVKTREEVLYREALAMGLDKQNTIIIRII